MEEVWKPVVGFEGYYEISSYGRVRSVERYVRQSNHLRYVPMKIKKIIPNRFGYPVVTLCRNRRSRQYGIHRLLAEAFIPNPENKPFVDHINTDITDFRLDNLRWVTAKENANNSLTLKHCRENTYTPERSKKIIESKSFSPEEYGIAFRKNSPQTLEKVNAAIKTLAQNGKLAEIADKYSLKEQIIAK